MFESSEVEGGGTSVVVASAAGSTSSSVVVSPVEEGGGGGATLEVSTLERLELALIWVAFCLREVAPMGAMIWIGSDAGNSINQDAKESSE